VTGHRDDDNGSGKQAEPKARLKRVTLRHLSP
jgi:hypothetical protein